MKEKSVEILPASVLESISHSVINEHTSHGRVTAAETFSKCLDIRDNSFLLPCMQRTAAAHAGHDLFACVSVCLVQSGLDVPLKLNVLTIQDK